LTEVLRFCRDWRNGPARRRSPTPPEGLLLASLMLLFGIVLMWWSFARGGTED